MQCKTEHGCITGFSNGQFNSRRLDLGDVSPSRHTPKSWYRSRHTGPPGLPNGASHAAMGSSERRSTLTLRQRCAAELCYMNVTQMYDILVQASAVLPNAGRTVVKQN